MQDILGALGERILILDGAMGTMLQSRGLSGNSEEFNSQRRPRWRRFTAPTLRRVPTS